jgi:iron-sulfur cluster insertion protein
MITLTPLAYTKLREIMVQEEKLDWNLRMGVRQGGCCGMDYLFGLDQQIHEDDQVFKHGDITIVCDAQSHEYLDGTEIGFEENEQGAGFVIQNPNACKNCDGEDHCSGQ